MHQVRIARPTRRQSRRTDLPPLVAVMGSGDTQEIDELLVRIAQLLEVK